MEQNKPTNEKTIVDYIVYAVLLLMLVGAIRQCNGADTQIVSSRSSSRQSSAPCAESDYDCWDAYYDAMDARADEIDLPPLGR